MAVIAVIGSPGSGKSFLSKQLAGLNNCPVFFEGEAGIFTEKFLKEMNSEEDSPERYNWLLKRLEEQLQRARKISDDGIDVYIDGGYNLVRGWLEAEIGDKSPESLKKWLDKNKELKEDLSLFVYNQEEKIIGTIKSRGRPSEQNEFILNRAIRIQREVDKLASSDDKIIKIDRKGKDFMLEKDLKELDELVKAHL